jgi:hypothetical protein
METAVPARSNATIADFHNVAATIRLQADAGCRSERFTQALKDRE